MKKIVALALTLACAVSTAAFAASNEPSVYLDGEKMTFEVNPFIENERTLVPFRAIFEAVGADVEWDGDTGTVIAVRDKGDEVTAISLQIDSTTAFVNGEENVLDVPAKLVDEKTFVPLRFVIEALGEKVEWDNDNYSVVITTAK